MKKRFALLLCWSAASAETYVSITQLQNQAAEGWRQGAGGEPPIHPFWQTGDESLWEGDRYLLPEPFGWDAI